MSPRRTPVGAGPPAARAASHAIATDDEAGFRIVAERHKASARWSAPRGGATTIMIVVAGAAREETPDGTVLLPRGTIAIRPSGSNAIAFQASPDGAHTVTIELAEKLLRAHPPALELLAVRGTFRGRSSVELAWRIAGELAAPDVMTPAALRVFVSGIVIGTSRYYLHHREASGTHPMAAAAQRILDKELKRPPSLRHLAQRVGCSPEHLARTFRASYGASVTEWTARRRVEAGKRLLAETDEQVGDIAQQLGFYDASHFARAFRRATTMTPARFRAAHKRINPVLSGAGSSNRQQPRGVRSLHD